MTIGAAQIALKTADLAPEAPFVLAGQGPLLMLFAWQLRQAGVRPDLILRLDDRTAGRRAVRHAPRALAHGLGDIAKGLRWARALDGAVRNVVALDAEGTRHIERVAWRTADGREGSAPARALFVHDGVVPNAQLTRALRAAHVYDHAAAAWRPDADPVSGALSPFERIFVAGDCAGVYGWKAAAIMGEAAGLAALRALGKPAPDSAFGKRLAATRAARPMLDALYRPARAFRRPADDVIVCRCEEVTAGGIRAAVRLGAQGPNQLKAFTRAGMGPCQGRMCAATTAEIIAAAQERPIADVGLMRVRMPIFPVTIGEMAELNDTPMDLPRS